MTRMTAISNWRTAEGEAERARFESLSANAFCAASLQRLYTLARGCMEFPHRPPPPRWVGEAMSMCLRVHPAAYPYRADS